VSEFVKEVVTPVRRRYGKVIRQTEEEKITI